MKLEKNGMHLMKNRTYNIHGSKMRS